MGRYIGYVAIVNNGNSVYYNLQLTHEVQGYNFKPLSLEERHELLPESQRKEINLSFDYRSTEALEKMSQYYQEESLYVIDFVTEDLEPNMKADMERNPTGYKLSGVDSIENGRIFSLDEAGFYLVMKDEWVRQQFTEESQIEVESPFHKEHMKFWGYSALVQLDGGMLAGPYEVSLRSRDGFLYIKPQLQDSKYVVWGYPIDNSYERTLTTSLAHRYGEYITVTVVPKDMPEDLVVYRDLMTEDQLLESFVESVELYGNGLTKLELHELGMVLEQYENSYLSSRDLPVEVRESRLHLMEDLFSSQQQLGDTLQRITSVISDLLEVQEEHQVVSGFFAQLGQKHPSLANTSVTFTGEKAQQLLDDIHNQEELVRSLRRELVDAQQNAGEVTKRALDERLKYNQSKHVNLSNELRQLKDELRVGRDVEALTRRKEDLQRDTTALAEVREQLMEANGFLEENIRSYVETATQDMANVAFSGYVSHQMISAAAQWEAEQNRLEYGAVLEALSNLEAKDLHPVDLVQYLVKSVQLARPTYHHNTILNMVICVCQGFLTVFAGEPGCGKTSICHILAQVLGLDTIAQGMHKNFEMDVNRYVEISVERGWTSKRDFVGYFNPLSKNFDKTNSKMYDALKILDLEQREGCSRFPLLVLLDEANLSPMEYYWADFMNICDDLNPQSTINLGEQHLMKIPPTLHFLATMNHDHTTEMLSPRLIDRSWVIRLPSGGGVSVAEEGTSLRSGGQIDASKLGLISWKSLESAFVADTVDLSQFSPEGAQVFSQLKLRLKELRITLSPRTELGILGYLTVATKYMIRGEQGEAASLIALDFVVAQKILPKVMGNGESYREHLEALMEYFEKSELHHSASLLQEIIERGDKQMKYYQFF